MGRWEGEMYLKSGFWKGRLWDSPTSAERAGFIVGAWRPVWVLARPGAVSSMTCRESVHSIISAADLMFISKQQLYNPKIDTKRVSVVPSQSDSGANRGRGDCWIREQPPESPAFQPQLRNFPAGAQSKPRWDSVLSSVKWAVRLLSHWVTSNSLWPFLAPGDLPDPGVKLTFLCVSSTGRRILYHCATWESP